MKLSMIRFALSALVVLLSAANSPAQITLLSVGELDGSRSGANADLSGLTYTLENGVPANILGGLGSGLAYAGRNTFLGLPDRGPNAVSFDAAVDNTVSYINRFHTITMDLTPNTTGTGLPFILTPNLRSTTLLWSYPLPVYGTGSGLGVGSGVPPVNTMVQHYFTGRSDNYDPNFNSGYPVDARFDPESIRVSSDGLSVFISDEYGPYVYQFSRISGMRMKTFTLPTSFYVTNLKPVGNDEISGNTIGRTANKGMEGLAITPDGKTLVGLVQAPLIQDNNQGATKLLRIVTIDIASAHVNQYAYLLTTGSGVSDIVAINDHEFLVDERDGKGRGDGSKAKIKQLFKIDLTGAVDVSGMDGPTASANAVAKTLFVDLVALFTANGIDSSNIPAKIEGIAFGPDVVSGSATLHTLWIANDNDFLQTVADPNGVQIPNPNQFYVVGFTDADLGASKYAPQIVADLK